MGFFGIFSKTAHTIWFIFSVKKDIIVLHVCAKFQVHKNFSSRHIGKKGVKSGGIRLFLKSYWVDLVPPPSERRHYIITYVFKFSSPQTFPFSRYWGKRGKNKGLPYLTKVVITRERLKYAFDIMAFLESA